MDSSKLRDILAAAAKLVVGPGNRWRTVAVLFALCNIKNLPFVWHFRFFQAAFVHTFKPRPIPQPESASDAFPLFLPVITSTRAPVLECDFNVHKSNSTYFTDLDVSRTHLIGLLGAPGLSAYHERRRTQGEKRLLLALGGVACFFHKEIKPYEAYEMWTRVLCWDHKWVYVVTHFVKKGSVKPDGYLMQPNGQGWWSSFTDPQKIKAQKATESEGSVNGAEKKDIFAFSIAKYVYKSGRLTIPPELVFQRCGVLPSKPEDSEPGPPSSIEDSGLIEQSMANGTDTPGTPESFDEVLQSSLTPTEARSKGWTWAMVEKERQRGMEIAKLFGDMDQLKGEFTGDSRPALGAYRDLLWV
ncbi:putative thioesterase [Hyphodiscus hymeniophilus]|uniref:Thioesterase n=1 Tax=Hyphodiscus hymeniophilus TaxID=353542 RepID=A0A9P7AUR7_9HELO|nr:putative thioesterase [Hyphodiscus hymeniophilus]